MTSVDLLVTREDVEAQTLQHVKNWLVYFLARIEEKKGLDPRTISPPRSWRVTDEFARRPEDAMPFVDVVSVGTERGRAPRRDGDGSIRAWYSVAIGAAVTARSQVAAKNLAGYYGAAIFSLMTKYPDLGGWADGCDWQGETYDDWPALDERTIATVREVFTVEVQGVVNVYDIPPYASDLPPDDPYVGEPEDPTVTTVQNDFDLEVT